MTPVESFAQLANSLVGLPISHVWRGYGSAIFLEFGRLEARYRRNGSPGNPEGEASLGVEWSWRIEHQAAILCGSWSEEHLWEPAFDLLRGARIARLETFGTLPEVAMTTDGGVRFLSFSTTEGQPRWYILDNRRAAPPRSFSVRAGQLHVRDGSETVD